MGFPMMRVTSARIVMLSALVVCLLAPAVASAQALVFVVRHAERADGGSMSAGAQQDPKLSPAGERRAQALAVVLGAAGIKGIYATEFHRTQDTAQPLATALRVPVNAVPASDTRALLQRIKADHAADIVLIVAHSNTMPEIITGLGGPAVKVGDDEYGDVFVVVPGTGVITRLKF